jgi:hypothetical protein
LSAASGLIAIGAGPVVTAALLIFALATHAKADIIYTIQNYSSLQNGYTITGTITTDGTIGILSASDITSTTFTISGPGGPYSYSGDNVSLTGDVQASATSITIPTGPISGPFNELGLGGGGGSGFSTPLGAGLLYDNAGNVEGTSGALHRYIGSDVNANMFIPLFANNGATPMSLPTLDDWTVAAVPEPSGLAPLGMVTMGLIGAAGRKRREKTA